MVKKFKKVLAFGKEMKEATKEMKQIMKEADTPEGREMNDEFKYWAYTEVIQQQGKLSKWQQAEFKSIEIRMNNRALTKRLKGEVQ
ncbi:hypothetical protein AAXE64_26945 [Priestia megaterium]